MKRAEELCRVAESRSIPRYTGFLSDREQMLAEAACHKATCGNFRFWGGYEGAERQVLCIEPQDAWQEEPLAYLCLQTYNAGTKLPTHRDYLGSLLGLGLDRACIGDLLQDPNDVAVFYAVVLADKAEFITANFSSAGHSPVHVEVCAELPPRLTTGPERELHEATVSALRADAVLAAMMYTSRTKAAEYIAAGRVGRFRLAEIGGKSKKDRQFISFYQY